MNNNIQLYLGDCLDILSTFSDKSIDLILTDPPYQLASITKRFGKKGSAPAKFGKDGAFQRASRGFMGKKWDVLPPIETWKEVLRVMKPGAFAFIMTTPRQDSLCQILMDLSEAGFCMGFSSIYWSYASGFPKASNIGKMVGKRLGKKRKKIGKGKSGKANTHKSSYQMANQGDKNTFDGEYEITKGDSPLEGSYAGFQPKPSIEIIIVAMKPIEEKTYVDQAMKNNHGITWLDDARIPYKNEKDMIPQLRDDKREVNAGKMYRGNSLNESKTKATIGGSKEGRFPANLIVSDDSLNDGKISKSPSGKVKRQPRKGQVFIKIFGE